MRAQRSRRTTGNVVGPAPEFSWTDGGGETGSVMVMPSNDDGPRIPSNPEPHDPLNGIRVGALIGGLFGALITALTSVANAWLVFIGAAVGAAVGYRSQRKR